MTSSSELGHVVNPKYSLIFLIKLPLASCEAEITKTLLVLQVDSASSKQVAGVGIRLKSPSGEVIEQLFRLALDASNNDVDYESLLAELSLIVRIRVTNLEGFWES